MFRPRIFFVLLAALEVAYNLPVEETIVPVELFHYCIDPENKGNEPEKSPVLLVHGLLGTHKLFMGIDHMIADRTKRRVCAVDLRNHGDSPWNNKSDVEAFTADLVHFLDTQNIKKVNLLGESLGGKVAVHFTLKHPERVDSLIVEESRPNSYPQLAFLTVKFAVRLIQKMIECQPEIMDEAAAKEWAINYGRGVLEKLGTFEDLPKNVSHYFDLRLVDGKWHPKHNMELLFEKINKPKEIWTKSTGLYTGPTLFIYGTRSFIKMDEATEEIIELFPNAKIIPIEGAGHLIHETHREFDDIVVEFLNNVN